MAELQIIIGDRARKKIEDGDILTARNDRRIQEMHLTEICHPKQSALRYGLRQNDSLAEVLLRLTSTYRFRRVNQHEVERLDLVTGDRDIIGPIPNGNGEYMDVMRHIEILRRHPHHALFGSYLKEVWYGGRSRRTLANLDHVWTEVELRTTLRKADHKLSPHSDAELSYSLCVSCDDFDNVERSRLEKDRRLPDGTLVLKRTHRVNWRLLSVQLGLRDSDVQNPHKRIDVRAQREFVRAAIVRTKP